MTVEVLILGADGMLGSACYRTFKENPNFKVSGTSRRGTSNLIKYNAFVDNLDFVLTKKYDYVINCIGIIKQKIDEDDSTEVLNMKKINSHLPIEIARICEANSTRAIQIATDCAYSGSRGEYTESDVLDATDQYGLSKIDGEIESSNVLNLRCSIVGREKFGHFSLLEWFLAQKYGSRIQGYTNHHWNGITADAFALILEGILTKDSFIDGNFHLIPSDQISKYGLLLLFQELFNRNDIDIEPTTNLIYVNRTLSTNYPEFNQKLWENSKIGTILPIKECIRGMV